MNLGYLVTPSGILKIFEIILVFASFSLSRDKGLPAFGHWYDTTQNNFYFGVGMLTAAMVVTPLLLAVYISGKMDIQRSIFEPVANAFFGASFIIYGSLMIANYDKVIPEYEIHDYGLAAGSLCLIAGLLYATDLYFAIKNFIK